MAKNKISKKRQRNSSLSLEQIEGNDNSDRIDYNIAHDQKYVVQRDAVVQSVHKFKKPRQRHGDQDQLQHPETIRISQSDHDRIYHLLHNEIDWDMAKNTSRKNVIREDDPNTPRLQGGKSSKSSGLNNKKEKLYCQSFIFGRNMKDVPNYNYSYWSVQYPTIYTAFQNLIEQYNPNFTYTHITVNKNLRCKRHTDGGNAGLSYIIGLGEYTGGELLIEPPIENQNDNIVPTATAASGNKKNNATTKVMNLYKTFVLFNGKTQPHETLPFTGTRYTIVYYTSNINNNATTAASTNHNNNNSSSTLLNVQHNSNSTDTRSTVHNTTTATTTTTTNHVDGVSDTLRAKFDAMKKKLGNRFKK